MTRMVVTEDVTATMNGAHLGPRWSAAYDEAIEKGNLARLEQLEEAQLLGEEDYGERWKQNVLKLAEDQGYEVEVLLTREVWRGTKTDAQDGEDWIERQLWQAAHDLTPLPEGW